MLKPDNGSKKGASAILAVPKKATAKAGSRTQTERRALSERRIIEAAMRVIGRKGTVRMTLAEVGAEAGYSRGLPAHLFGSKDGLLIRVVESLIETRTPYVLPAWEPGRGIDGLIDTVGHWIDATVIYPEYFRTFQILIGEASCEDPENMRDELRVLIRRMDSATQERLAEYLKEGKSHGEIRRNIDPAAYAFIIVGGLRGIISQWILNPGAFDLKRVGRLYLAEVKMLLLRGESGTSGARKASLPKRR